ncbi:MAG: hypothetical protein HYV96_18550 [Opitutae bacterium]|nr:hypothetical protein [Opitutae bacterium]
MELEARLAGERLMSLVGEQRAGQWGVVFFSAKQDDAIAVEREAIAADAALKREIAGIDAQDREQPFEGERRRRDGG